ncbi:hypothetical protein DFH27DRAFT_90497 [Peziza echinospora]|nr:hypothetical protein DFH27DRAFT_90497 [Peziza echinospora]
MMSSSISTILFFICFCSLLDLHFPFKNKILKLVERRLSSFLHSSLYHRYTKIMELSRRGGWEGGGVGRSRRRFLFSWRISIWGKSYRCGKGIYKTYYLPSLGGGYGGGLSS